MTQTKKMIVGGTLILAILLVLALAFAVPKTQVANADPLPSLQNVAVDGDGVLRWDAFSGAAEYNVLFGSGGGYARDGEGNSVTYYDLETTAKRFHWESGTYNWSVWAVDEGGNDLTVTASGTYTFTNTQTPLDTPTNLYWEHTVLRWDNVEGAGFYYVSVYKNGAFINGMSGDAYDNYKDFGTSFEVDKTYRCEVEARASYDDLEHKTSVATVSPDKTFSSVVPSLTNVTVTDGQLTFDAVAGAYRYDIVVYNGGGIRYALPIDLYAMCAGSGLADGTYDVRINVYNEDKEPLVPEYTYEGFVWDTAFGPQPITGTVTIVGDAKVGVTLSADASSVIYEGDLTYTWWVKNVFDAWNPYGEMNRVENTFYIPDELLGRQVRVRVESSDSTGWLESDPTDEIAERTHTVEIVSVGGNTVAVEREDGMMVEGTMPMGRIGEAYSATLMATGASSYVWSLVSLGDLAEGLSLDPDTGVISGTPTGTATGYITVKAADSADPGNFDVVNLTFIVAGTDWAPTITTGSIENAVVDDDYSYTIECTYGGPADNVYWEVVTGALPSGLDLGMDGFFNSRLSGTPTLVGSYTFTLRASNAFGSDVKEYTIVVENQMTVTYPEGKYYLGDTVQLIASIGNANVNWSIGVANSANTTISESGLLTIGEDETASYITVNTTSKTNGNNTDNAIVYYRRKLAYTVTVVDGVATDSSDNPISRAGQGEDVYIEAIEKDGYRFRNWTVEEGSAEVEIDGENYDSTSFVMPGGNVIVKANYDRVIDTVSATFDRPVNGQSVDKTLETGSSNYTATLHAIWLGSAFVSIDDVVYETGRDYSFYLRFVPAAGCVLVDNSNLSVTLNGVAIPYEAEENKGYNPLQGAWFVTLTAVSDEIPHFAVSIEHGSSDASLAAEGQTISITASEPEEGFTFDRWTSEDGVTFANAESAETTFVMLAKAVTVTATYKVIQRYTISFAAGEGSGTMSAQQFNEGASYTLPACLFVAPTNKQFKCWSVGGVEKQVGDEIVVNSDMVVSAVWQSIRKLVSFSAGEGTGSMTAVYVDQGSTYTLPTCTLTAPQGKIFKFWHVNGANLDVGSEIVVNADVTVYAIWEQAQRTIHFSSGDGTGEKTPVEVNIGDIYPLPDAPFEAPEGKMFAGWSLSPNGAKIAGDSIVVDDDIQLYALWKDIEQETESTQPGETITPGAAETSDETETDVITQPTVEPKPDDGSGLTGGAIAGIVIGCVFGLLIIACVVLFLLHKKGVVKIAFLSKLFEKKDASTALPEGEKTEEAKTTETPVRNESDGKEE